MTPVFVERYELVVVVPALEDLALLAETQEVIDIDMNDPRLISEVSEIDPTADAYAPYVTLKRIEQQ